MFVCACRCVLPSLSLPPLPPQSMRRVALWPAQRVHVLSLLPSLCRYRLLIELFAAHPGQGLKANDLSAGDTGSRRSWRGPPHKVMAAECQFVKVCPPFLLRVWGEWPLWHLTLAAHNPASPHVQTCCDSLLHDMSSLFSCCIVDLRIHTLIRPIEMLLPVIMPVGEIHSQPACAIWIRMATTSSFPVHVSYLLLGGIHVEGGGWLGA